MWQLLSGLSALHSQGIIHRNLKPKHLLLDYSRGAHATPTLKISDFGLTRASSLPPRSFTPDQVTIWYRPPEILLGYQMYTTAVDMWSAGCIFGEMWHGAAMFRESCEIGMLFKICSVLGTPTEEEWKKLGTMENYEAAVLPKFQPRRLDSVLAGVDGRAIDLLGRMVVCDPDRR